MATLALAAVGSAIGGALIPGGISLLGATLTGAAIGGQLGALAGTVIDGALFGASPLQPAPAQAGAGMTVLAAASRGEYIGFYRCTHRRHPGEGRDPRKRPWDL